MKTIVRKLLMALVLAVTTVTVWQFRFQHQGPDLSRPFERGLPGWDWRSGAPVEPDSEGTLALSLAPDGKPRSIERVLGPLEGVRFLRVALDARWTDVRQSGEVRWATARALVFGKRADGTYTWPKDHWVINATGSAPWHREEIVFDLMPDQGELRFAVEHLGEAGSLEVRDVEISVVRQRAWFPAAIVGLVSLWIAWSAWWVLPSVVRWKVPRAMLAGGALVLAFWYLVLPQPRFCFRPLVGPFRLGPPVVVPPAPPQPAPASPGPVTPPPVAMAAPESRIPVTPPARPVETTPVAPPPPNPPPPVADVAPRIPSPVPPPQKREAHPVEQWIRSREQTFAPLHLVVFTAFGLVLFSLARPRVWPLAACIALASEALPNYQFHQPWDAGDFGDLSADAAGLLLAALVVTVGRRLWKRRRISTADPPAGSAPAPG